MTAAARIDPADPGGLRRALGRFATGVTVITAPGLAGSGPAGSGAASPGADGRPMGFTANSFNSVSLDPPLILWSLARGSARLPAYRAAPAYAVNVLSTLQTRLARRFAGPVEDRFAGVTWEPGLEGAPVLAGALAVFECRHEAIHPAGDHELFIGRVERVRVSEGRPLTYFGGGFGTVMGELEADAD